MAASRKSIQCLSFMFEQLILQLNAIIIMYELLGRKKRFVVSSYICLKKNKWIQRQKFLRRHHLLRKPSSVWVARGSTDEWWSNVKREDLLNTW